MANDFLQLAGRRILVTGVANRKSVAWHVAKTLRDADADVVYAVRTPERLEQLAKLAPGAEAYVCDVGRQEEIDRLARQLGERNAALHGMVHSIAFADYASGGPRPFHETTREQFLRTCDISCYSLIALSHALRESFAKDASVVALSISTTRMASENYGFMAPIKAALDSSLVFLAKSFSNFSEVRFNAVGPGLLKTSASAGIPGYVDSYLFAEAATLRRRAVATQEAANAAAFLLSPSSSGINAQCIVVDAGMGVNYFDQRIVRAAVEGMAMETKPQP